MNFWKALFFYGMSAYFMIQAAVFTFIDPVDIFKTVIGVLGFCACIYLASTHYKDHGNDNSGD